MKTSRVKFKTPEELEALAREYFKKYPFTDDENLTPEEHRKAIENLTAGILPTISGLCYFIGLQSINEWYLLRNKQKFKRVCERLTLALTRFWEAASATGRGQTGVSNWLDTFANFPQKQALNQENRPAVAVVVIGSDGNKQALSDIISTAQAQRIQGIKTIEAKAQEIPTHKRIVSRETSVKPLKKRKK